MSTGENDIPVQGGDSVAGHSAPVAASEAPKGELKSSSKPQPFKLPYSNQFDVVFRDVHAMGNKDRVYSDPVTFGPLKWRVLLFPYGNNSNNASKDNMSAYLDVAEADVMEEGWRLQTTVGLELINQIDSSRNVSRQVAHKFQISARDIGYAAFHPFRKLFDPLEGYYVNNTMLFHVSFKVTQSWVERPDDLSRGPAVKWDSKKETGFVGLQNQGATCYLNSLLQSLYHLPRFRHLVYSIKAEPNSSSASLQRLFWKLDHDDDSVSTTELTKSFGWNIEDIAVQHDVQELLRKLIDKLEEKVKDSPQKGLFEKLFRGTYMDILKCLNVNYERKQEIAYCDLSLNVIGCDTLEDSLRKFTETETLDGENRYKSDEFGYQDAHKGIKLNTLPPVLHLHLKRFDYQYQNEPPTLEKVNAKQVFPPSLKMGEFLDVPVEDSDETTYDLFGCLVHSGSAQAGHYYAFMRPAAGQPNWYKFDDSKVSHATESDAIDDNFGGDEITEMKIGGKEVENTQRFATEKHSSAYMLVYVRRPDIGMVFSDSTLPEEESFLSKMNEEMERIKLEEKQLEEMRRYCQVRVYTADEAGLFVNPIEALDLNNNDSDSPRGGFQTYNYAKSAPLPVLDSRKARLVSIKKDALMKNLKVEIEKQLGVPVARQRLWTVRDYSTTGLRLERPITVEQCNTTVTNYSMNARANAMAMSASMYRDEDFEFEIFVEVNDDIPIENTHVQPHLREEGDAAHDNGASKAPVSEKPVDPASTVPRADITAEYGLGIIEQPPHTKPLGHALSESRNEYFDDYTSFEAQAQSAGPNQKGFPSLDETKLLFVRYFDPKDSTFVHLGQIYFPDGGSLELLEDAIVPLLAKKEIPQKREDYLSEFLKARKEAAAANGSENNEADFELDDLLFFYSDAHFDMSDALDTDTLQHDHRSTHGAWVTVQYAPRTGEKVAFRTAKACLTWHKSRITFSFYDITTASQSRDPPHFSIAFTSETLIQEIWASLGSHLNWPADCIALSPSYAGSAAPIPNSVLFDGKLTVARAFASSLYRASFSSVPVFYEKLEMSLLDTKTKTAVKAIFVDRNVNAFPVSLFLTAPPVAADLIEAARVHPKVVEKLSKPNVELRVFEFDDKRCYYHEKAENDSLNAYTTYGVDEVAPEESLRNMALIVVYLIHVSASAFYAKPTHMPFTLVVDPMETVFNVKLRILQRIQRLNDDPDAQMAQIANVDCWLHNPAMHSTLPCNNETTFEEFDTEELYVYIRAPSPETPRTQVSENVASDAQTGSVGAGAGVTTGPASGDVASVDPKVATTKDKPRNALHLGD